MFRTLKERIVAVALALGLGLALAALSAQTSAALTVGAPAVQVLEGVVRAGDFAAYRLDGLKRGDRISGHLLGASGNLSPVLALVALPFDSAAFRQQFKKDTDKAVRAGDSLRAALDKLAAAFFLAWGAGGDAGYDAELNGTAPVDCEYKVLVAGEPAPVSGAEGGAEPSFGRFRLVLGLNPVAAISQDSRAVGAAFAREDLGINPAESQLQTITGELSPARPRVFWTLNTFDTGDTLSVRIENTDGKPPPVVRLLDFGQKILARSALDADGRTAVLSYEFKAPAEEFRLRLSGDEESFGAFRVKLGNNVGAAERVGEDHGAPVVRPPTPVTISIQLDQISSIAQRDGKFSVVATMRMQWRDPGYAFSPGSCKCNFKTFDLSGFRRFIEDRHLRWPEFIIYNLQGRRTNQGVLIFVDSSGTARYMERFSAALQAPDLDFRQFPFDSQNFYIHIDSIYSNERYKFISSPTKNALGSKVGVDEWVVSGFDTSTSLTDEMRSRFTFHIVTKRHLGYYIMKIFMPLMIILMTSWATFLLKDYNKRIDVTGAHLLLFVAFNFTISNDLPRLGYITFMDTILASAFVVGALLIVLNVYLKRRESAGRLEEIRHTDRVLLTLYPVGYFLPWLIAMIGFGIIF